VRSFLPAVQFFKHVVVVEECVSGQRMTKRKVMPANRDSFSQERPACLYFFSTTYTAAASLGTLKL
jgi:hypothetical protein